MSKKAALFDEGDADDSLFTINVNKKFASNYEERKTREVLSRAKTSMFSSDEDSDSEVEDEDGALMTPAVEKDILRTISLIKARDPRVYDSKVDFFEGGAIESARAAWEEKKNNQYKPMTIGDYNMKKLLSGEYAKDEEEEQQEAEPAPRTFVQEQADLREAFLRTAQADLAEEEGQDFDMFRRRAKSQTELEAEEADFAQFMQAEEEKAAKRKVDEMETLRRYWTDPNLTQEERFLRDFITNKKWLDRDGASNEPPTYDEVVGTDDEEELDRQDNFESQYNFRFQEEGASDIVSHPRQLEGSVRRTESKRKRQRESQKERKAAEKEEKRRELERLKLLKQKDILEKLQKIQAISGAKVSGFEEIDLEKDFDPEEYDRKMSQMFDENYYDPSNAEGDEALFEKPVFDDDETAFLDDFNYDDPEAGTQASKRPRTAAAADEEEDYGAPFNMDADFGMGDAAEAAPLSKKAKKKLKKQQQQASAESLDSQIEQYEAARKNVADPQAASHIDNLVDEYYNLNYEDLVGDLPTRFKYRKVEPQTFGLTMEEILYADDRELNAHISLKKMAPYRHESVARRDARKATKAQRVREFREQMRKRLKEQGLLKSLRGTLPDEVTRSQKTLRKRTEKKSKDAKKPKEAKKSKDGNKSQADKKPAAAAAAAPGDEDQA
ncbi:hypothetical protein H696_01368 [Fonticula alba]|uniref:Kri1-like C-terminal domain-containing protein n=1 Tax=Fonticula alba TaxID=691883 RepID=A0A058ZC55_FONAL|nr:hypothetical protein H696_01368 [Fonticula alba]KCV71959.1 hypothetical protein H696_01368 [Fonticula alba]|eukprot:XP_009493537.1 hypothetical protein H696_01368 [Fonticula alba]